MVYLDPDGALYTENLRPALSTDAFILKGARTRETFEPHFTFHGFRYIEVTGYPGRLAARDLRATVIASDTPQTGTWSVTGFPLWPDIIALADEGQSDALRYDRAAEHDRNT